MTLSKEAYDRMDGLVTIKQVDKLKAAAAHITKELKEEGFEEDEIQSFLNHETDLIVLYEFL